MNISKQKLSDCSEAKSLIDSKGASSSKEMFEEVVSAIAQGEKIPRAEAFKHADSRSPTAMKYWQQMQAQDGGFDKILGEVRKRRSSLDGQSAQNKLDNFSVEYGAKIQKNPSSEVKELANQQGLTESNVRSSINTSKVDLETQKNQMVSENNVQRNSIEKANEMDERDMQKRIDKYEEDRIGKGITSKVIGGASNIVTLGKAGREIGGPDEFADKDYDHSSKPSRIKIEKYQKAKNVKPEDRE